MWIQFCLVRCESTLLSASEFNSFNCGSNSFFAKWKITPSCQTEEAATIKQKKSRLKRNLRNDVSQVVKYELGLKRKGFLKLLDLKSFSVLRTKRWSSFSMQRITGLDSKNVRHKKKNKTKNRKNKLFKWRFPEDAEDGWKVGIEP